MLTRRDAIRVALGIPAGLSAIPAWAFAAKEFWETKPASEWSSEEVDRMLTKSPWAKEAVVSYNGGRGASATETTPRAAAELAAELVEAGLAEVESAAAELVEEFLGSG